VTECVTLITGASSGIGSELARIFAANGHRVALVARRAERLTKLANDIETASVNASRTTPVKPPIIIPCDLEKPEAVDVIVETLKRENVEVDHVVNNAGFGLFGQATELDRGEQLGIIDVNIRAMTDLSLRFADQLIRHRGGILNVASIAGFLPGPGMAVYYASKAYVLSFTEALRQELASRRVRVTALCPGPVPSEFQLRAGFEPGFDSLVLNVSAREVARQGYRGLMANKRIVIPGLGVRAVPVLLRMFPRGFILAAVGRLQLRRR